LLVIRFLLGLSVVGLFPRIVLQFTCWFSDQHRGRIVFSFALPLPSAHSLVPACIATRERSASIRFCRTGITIRG
jgi:hypothetical protein